MESKLADSTWYSLRSCSYTINSMFSMYLSYPAIEITFGAVIASKLIYSMRLPFIGFVSGSFKSSTGTYGVP